MKSPVVIVADVLRRSTRDAPAKTAMAIFCKLHAAGYVIVLDAQPTCINCGQHAAVVSTSTLCPLCQSRALSPY